MAKTIFVTYQFEGAPYSANTAYGLSTPIHCNYIETIETDTLANSTINFLFSEDEFPFLADGSTNPIDGYGWTAYKLNALVQIVEGTDVEADPAAWKILDVTDQTIGWVSGETLQKTGLTTTLYEIKLPDYNVAPLYDLSYLNYPTRLPVDDDKLTWGEEVFFYGNVKTTIRATAYTTDIPIVMQLNQFNSTTNPTWDTTTPVSVSEVGIYDNNNNLVAIGKLNNPIDKDSTIARTIVFAMDF